MREIMFAIVMLMKAGFEVTVEPSDYGCTYVGFESTDDTTGETSTVFTSGWVWITESGKVTHMQCTVNAYDAETEILDQVGSYDEIDTEGFSKEKIAEFFAFVMKEA